MVAGRTFKLQKKAVLSRLIGIFAIFCVGNTVSFVMLSVALHPGTLVPQDPFQFHFASIHCYLCNGLSVTVHLRNGIGIVKMVGKGGLTSFDLAACVTKREAHTFRL